MIRIAIVEDDTGYRSQLGKYIDQYQSDFSETVSVSEFSDGLEIVEKYKSEYDIILMDIQMKHMDGMQAAMRIRDMDKNVITRIETNKRYVTDVELKALTEIFHVSYEYLIDGEGEEEEP